MTDFSNPEESSQLQRLTSNAYSLIVRQGPERGKAFFGSKDKAELKDKDRKPVDPPPIIQLQIRDPSDPASNYLQSPYFFMCCNLCDADLSRPGQLSAAMQGEDADSASQSALAGTLVSSLHRLKDVDNTDGGFFIFPDISVRVEGEFRLRFSLFEMLKTAPKVVYIKSVHTEPFTVFSPRAFPGMSESTFLSRSFGDQGVKLRIRKEPRVLGKRSAHSDVASESTQQQYLPQRANYAGMGPQNQPIQPEGYGASAYRDPAAGYDDLSPSKRPRRMTDFSGRAAYVQDERTMQQSFAQYPGRDVQTPNRSGSYIQQPGSAQSAEFPFSTHQRSGSISATSPFAPSRTDPSTYGYSNQGQLFQQPRDQNYQFSYGQYQTPRPTQQVAQPVPQDRQLPSSIPSQAGALGSYGRQDEQHPPDMRYQAQTQRTGYQPQSQGQQNYAPSQQNLPRTLPQPQAGTAQASALPPLGTSFPTYTTTTNGGGSEIYPTSGGQAYGQNFVYRGGRENG